MNILFAIVATVWFLCFLFVMTILDIVAEKPIKLRFYVLGFLIAPILIPVALNFRKKFIKKNNKFPGEL